MLSIGALNCLESSRTFGSWGFDSLHFRHYYIMGRRKVIAYYLQPEHFDARRVEVLTRYLKLQVDLSIELGWQPSEILIFTNIDFEHREVRPLRVNWLRDPKKCFFNKYLCVYHAQALYPGDLILCCDHDAFQLRDLDWGLLSRSLIATPVKNDSNFLDSFCTFRADSHVLVKQYVKFLHMDLPFRCRDFWRHGGAYSGELNQRLVKGFRQATVALKLCDLVCPGQEPSLDPNPVKAECLQDFQLVGYDAAHLHLDCLAHRDWAKTNPILGPLIEGY